MGLYTYRTLDCLINILCPTDVLVENPFKKDIMLGQIITLVLDTLLSLVKNFIELEFSGWKISLKYLSIPSRLLESLEYSI